VAGGGRKTLSVKVRFFAHYRERAGDRSRQVDLPAGSTVGDLLRALAGQGTELPGEASVAVNHAYAGRDQALSDGDEVAFIPPVSGG
jgi:molybdopterin synthase catalytic subunit